MWKVTQQTACKVHILEERPHARNHNVSLVTEQSCASAASCRLAGEQLAASCQQYRSAAAAFPELTGKDNDTLEVPIDKVKIWGWYDSLSSLHVAIVQLDKLLMANVCCTECCKT